MDVLPAIDLIDGKFNIVKMDDEKECKQLIRVNKLRNQDYKKFRNQKTRIFFYLEEY